MNDTATQLEVLTTGLRRRFGTQALRRAVELAPRTATTYVSSGFTRLDAVLPGGGLPRGRLTLIGGSAAAAGALTLALRSLAQAQHSGGLAGYIDLGATFAADYAARCGIDLQRLVIARPGDAATAATLIGELLTRHAVRALLIDNVSRLATLPGSPGSLVPLARRLPRLLATSDCLLLGLVTQSGHGAGATAPLEQVLGGRAALRLEVRHAHWLRYAGAICGRATQVRVAPAPATTVTLALHYPVGEALP